MEKNFTIESKKISLYSPEIENAPIFYFNSHDNVGEEIYDYYKSKGKNNFTLVTISNIKWDEELSPWFAPTFYKGKEDYLGEADKFLNLITNRIIPTVEEEIENSFSWRGLIGYSLAGLFALYAPYKTNLFSRIGSISGSLWYPNFIDFAENNKISSRVDKIYLSVGSKEAKVRNPLIKEVRNNTEALANFYQEKGIQTKFVLNPGSHFQNGLIRTVDGISWLLQ